MWVNARYGDIGRGRRCHHPRTYGPHNFCSFRSEKLLDHIKRNAIITLWQTRDGFKALSQTVFEL